MSSRTRYVSPRRLKGFQDYLPGIMAIRQAIISAVRDQAQLAGFMEVGTPALEYSEVLLGVGGETDKQVFLFEDGGGRSVGMRYDLTVPFARLISENYGKTPMPFKRFQTGDVWRAEKPQKGRYREFAQADLDIVGVDSINADVEVMSNLMLALDKALDRPLTMLCNHRAILSVLIKKHLKISTTEEETQALIILDKLDKIGADQVSELFAKELSVSAESALSFISLLENSSIDSLSKEFSSEEDKNAWTRFTKTVALVQESLEGKKVNVKIDLSVARGLAYYTGIVFETTVDGIDAFGSICSGGRYDQLTQRFTKHEMPGVGGSVGVDRLAALMAQETSDLREYPNLTKVQLVIADDDSLSYALKILGTLRAAGIASDLPLKSQKMAAQMKAAHKKEIPCVVIVGQSEASSDTVSVKFMESGEEHKALPREKLIDLLRTNMR